MSLNYAFVSIVYKWRPAEMEMNLPLSEWEKLASAVYTIFSLHELWYSPTSLGIFSLSACTKCLFVFLQCVKGKLMQTDNFLLSKLYHSMGNDALNHPEVFANLSSAEKVKQFLKEQKWFKTCKKFWFFIWKWHSSLKGSKKWSFKFTSNQK